MRSKMGFLFTVLITFLFATPLPAYANMYVYSASSTALLSLCFIYIFALSLSRRIFGLTWENTVFWLIFSLLMLVFGLFAHLWAFYIGLQFSFLLLKKDRVVFQDRQADLIWYGAWTGIIIVSSLIAEGVFWSDNGGLQAWILQLGREYHRLGLYALFGIPILIYLIRHGKITRIQQTESTDEAKIDLSSPH